MRIAFVCPRYGIGASGGAAIHVEWLAKHLKEAGLEIEVLTTCAKDHFGWDNYYPAGEEDIEGIKVRRFRVDDRDTIVFLRIQNLIMAGEKVSHDDQVKWSKESVNSASMYKYIRRASGDYDYFVFIPYMFGTTINGSKVCPEKSILIPTLHDEIYAYLDIFKDMFQRFRGIMFSTPPELGFGKKLYELSDEKVAIVALGFDEKREASAERFQRRYEIGDFCLYIGRRETGKNTPLLVDYFRMHKKYNQNALKLAFIGSGELAIPEDSEEDILDLGYVSNEDKYDAHAAAMFLCQPSVNESLSIVMMESWLAGVPVLAHSGCAVTKFHCRKSNGGLYFGDYFEFEECLNYFLNNREQTSMMGANGKKYVKENYSWDRVVQRFKDALEKFK